MFPDLGGGGGCGRGELGVGGLRRTVRWWGMHAMRGACARADATLLGGGDGGDAVFQGGGQAVRV